MNIGEGLDDLVKREPRLADGIAVFEPIPTLRDQFAMAAIHGCLIKCSNSSAREQVATEAYALADAMLKAREA